MKEELELVIRLVIAFVLGIVFGLEREKRHKPAGLRTHVLVALGAALFTLAGIYGFRVPSIDGMIRNNDPTRVAAQIVTGVGFIGGGIIFKDRDNIRGITTAASIWLTAGLGMGIASGLYLLTGVAALLGLLGLEMDHLMNRSHSNEKQE